MRASEINTESCERLKLLLTKYHITQKEIADGVGYSVQHISRIKTGKSPLTLETAKAICNVVNQKRMPISKADEIRFEWLMAFDNYMTHLDRVNARDSNYSAFIDNIAEEAYLLQAVQEELQNARLNVDGLHHILDYVKMMVASGLYKGIEKPKHWVESSQYPEGEGNNG